MRRALFLFLSLGCSAGAVADEVFLRGGGRLSGVVLERSATSLVMEVGPGRVSLPLSRVERIAESSSALAEYAARAARLASTDVAGWLELARWARDHDLLTQAREALERVLAVDPGNSAANAGLGKVLLGGRWLSADESYRARGYVSFEGAWLRPEERDAILRERGEAVAAMRARAEAEARLREAEARARAAEAEARRAEAAAREAEMRPAYRDPGYGSGYAGIVTTALGCGRVYNPYLQAYTAYNPYLRGSASYNPYLQGLPVASPYLQGPRPLVPPALPPPPPRPPVRSGWRDRR